MPFPPKRIILSLINSRWRATALHADESVVPIGVFDTESKARAHLDEQYPGVMIAPGGSGNKLRGKARVLGPTVRGALSLVSQSDASEVGARKNSLELDGARLCPDEYAAWGAARARYRDLAARFLDGDTTVTEADCLAAKDLADRAEADTRAALRLRGVAVPASFPPAPSEGQPVRLLFAV